MGTSIAVIPVSHQQAASEPSLITLEIFLNAVDFVGKYDRLEVWRSLLTQSGPYTELTAASDLPAQLPKTSGPQPHPAVLGPDVYLDQKQLFLRVNEDKDLTITFNGSPMNYADAVTQVIAQGQHLVTAYDTEVPEFVIQTLGVGSGARLRVLGGDAAPQLKLPIDELARGKDARLALADSQQIYRYNDWFGSRSYFYKVRYRNSATGVTSEYTQPFSVGTPLVTAPTSLVVGEMTIVLADGRPLVNQEVRLYTTSQVGLNGPVFMTGSDLVQKTDAAGHVEFLLNRGQVFSLSVPSTSMFRLIRAPLDTAIQRFDLMSADVAEQDDNFKVAVPRLIAASRRTL